MVDGCVLLSYIVSYIVGTWLPVVAKLFLCDPAVHSVYFHVHGLESFACDVFSHYSKVGGFVGLYWHGRLSMSHYFQLLAY